MTKIVGLLFELFVLIVLENRNATLLIAISHVMKFIIVIARNHLFDFISQSNYYVTEIFNRSFFKKNIETKDGFRFIKSIKENCEKISRSKSVQQIRLSKTTWDCYSKKMLDNMKKLALLKLKVIWFRCKGCLKGFPVIKYAYVACLKVTLMQIRKLCNTFVFM